MNDFTKLSGLLCIRTPNNVWWKLENVLPALGGVLVELMWTSLLQVLEERAAESDVKYEEVHFEIYYISDYNSSSLAIFLDKFDFLQTLGRPRNRIVCSE